MAELPASAFMCPQSSRGKAVVFRTALHCNYNTLRYTYKRYSYETYLQ